MAPSASASKMSPNQMNRAAAVQDRPIYPPSLPSNLQRDADQDVVFNSIGFYSDLLTRLDDQIKSTEQVFVTS